MTEIAKVDVVARAKSVAEELAGAADEIERTRRIPEPLLSHLHEARLFRMLMPRAVGGDEVPPHDYAEAMEELARHDGSVAWNVFVGNSSALIAPFLPPETAKHIFADPRTVVAWGPPTATNVKAVPGGYLINGKWDFASGCRQANWMGVHCRVEEADGTLRLNAAGRPTFRTLLFPISQATLLDTWDTIGLCGTASDSYRVENVVVSEAFSGTREDPAGRWVPGPLYAIPQQGLYAVGVAGVALGLARAMLDAFADLSQRKTPRGQSQLSKNPAVRSGFARAEANLGASRAYLLTTLADIYTSADDMAPIDIPTRARVRLATAHTIQTAIGVADFVYKAAGVDAIFSGSPFGRRFRDMHTLSQQIQSRESHFEAVGQIMLDEPPDVFY